MSVSLETLERIKAQLKQARDQGSSIKLDLYTHLTEVFNRIMLHHPYDAFDKFEEISHLVKQTHLKIKDPKFDYDVNSIQNEQTNPSKEAWINKSQKLLREVSTMQKAFQARNFSKNSSITEAFIIEIKL
jgi:hypothetical protein